MSRIIIGIVSGLIAYFVGREILYTFLARQGASILEKEIGEYFEYHNYWR